jgi:nitrate reductase NapE component
MRTRLMRFAALVSAIWTLVALALAGGAGVTGW